MGIYLVSLPYDDYNIRWLMDGIQVRRSSLEFKLMVDKNEHLHKIM
jgi:hypothetical protein